MRLRDKRLFFLHAEHAKSAEIYFVLHAGAGEVANFVTTRERRATKAVGAGYFHPSVRYASASSVVRSSDYSCESVVYHGTLRSLRSLREIKG